jgi:hypothetical protein
MEMKVLFIWVKTVREPDAEAFLNKAMGNRLKAS